MDNFFDLYDLLIDGIDTAETVTRTFMGQCWTAVETEKSFGMAMTTPVDTAPVCMKRIPSVCPWQNWQKPPKAGI